MSHRGSNCATLSGTVPTAATARPPRRVLLLTLLVCALAGPSFWLTGTAQAKCGQKRSAGPAQRPGVARPPLVIGDSVLYDAVPGLARLGFEANGMICRRMDQGLAILRSRAKRRILPRLVVLELGANGTVTTAQVDEALALVGSRGKLVLLTPTDTDRPKGADAIVMRLAALRTPARVRVLEWATLAAVHPEWMAKDGVHLRNQAGIDGLIALIAQSTSAAPPPPPPTTGGLPAP